MGYEAEANVNYGIGLGPVQTKRDRGAYSNIDINFKMDGELFATLRVGQTGIVWFNPREQYGKKIEIQDLKDFCNDY